MKKIFLYASAAALVLSGCTKEMAENIAPSISGEDMIVASLASDAGTRTHLQENGAYGWDDTADALGVFAAAPGNAVNAYFGYAGKDDNDKTIFKGNLKSIKGGDFIAYYPYSDGKAITTDGKLEFRIPATQYYNHNYTGGYGSFDAGVVPMVAKNETTIEAEDKGNTLQLEFDPLASFVSVPFKGDGKINTIRIQRLTKGGSLTTSKFGSGTFTVDMFTPDNEKTKNFVTEKNTDEETGEETTERVPVMDETFFTVSDMIYSSVAITLDCGDGIYLKPDEAIRFVFVVPPYIEFDEGEGFGFQVNGESYVYKYQFPSKNTTGRNKLLPIPNSFVYDGEGRYRIENENQFVEYAYAATMGNIVNPEMKSGTVLKAAVIIKPLNFNNYTYSGSYEKVEGWYNVENGGAIATIGGPTAPALHFSIAGEGDITISGLKVKGDGLFAGNSQGSAVKNISFSGLKVEDDKNGGVLTDNLYAESVATTYSGVVLNDVQEGKAVVGRVQATALKQADAITYPEGTVFANTLVADTYKSFAFESEVAAAAEVEEEASDVYKPAFTVPARYANFNTLEVPQKNPGVIFYVDYDSKNSIYAKELMTKVVLADKNGWYSVLDNVQHWSYWTGTSAANNNDRIYTAEELVYDLSTKNEIILDTDIDFGINKAKLENVVVNASSLNVDGGSKTIKRANIYGDGFFGKNATVKNLNVSSSFVYGTAVLAKTGTAPEGVALNNINYSNATEKILGGMFYEGTFEQAKQTKGKVIPTNIEGKKFGAHYAKMTVTLGVEDNTLLPADAPYAVIVCKGEGLNEESSKNTNIYFEEGADLEAIANKIEWAGEIPTDYQVELISGDSRKNLTYDGKVYDDEMLKNAMEAALSSNDSEVTITVAPGTYGAFTYGSNDTYNKSDKKITIDCNGAEFKGNNQMRFGEHTTIKNARINNTANNAHFVSGNFVDCIFEGEDGHGFSNVYASSGTTLTFTNCTFYAANYATKPDGTFDTSRALHIAENKNVTVIVNDCHFYGYCPISNEPKITFDGCDFHPTDKGTGDFAGVGLRGHALVKNCTFELAAELCDHNELAFKAATNSSGEAYKYEIYGCTVNGDAFSPLADYVTIEKEQTTIYYSDNAEGTGAVGVVPPVTGEKPAKK